DISPPSTQDEIETAYREKARETHPDTGGSKDDFLEVQRAYETLTNSDESPSVSRSHRQDVTSQSPVFMLRDRWCVNCLLRVGILSTPNYLNIRPC
ncbi:MAG: DnaJ-class molecular chaperone with C-terminal Zn finger domain protein, partial [Haloquadratum walsbyi J07HQW1]